MEPMGTVLQGLGSSFFVCMTALFRTALRTELVEGSGSKQKPLTKGLHSGVMLVCMHVGLDKGPWAAKLSSTLLEPSKPCGVNTSIASKAMDPKTSSNINLETKTLNEKH